MVSLHICCSWVAFRQSGGGGSGENSGGGKSNISGLTCWMVDRVAGAEVFCSEDAGEGEGVARGRGKGGAGSSE